MLLDRLESKNRNIIQTDQLDNSLKCNSTKLRGTADGFQEQMMSHDSQEMTTLHNPIEDRLRMFRDNNRAFTFQNQKMAHQLSNGLNDQRVLKTEIEIKKSEIKGRLDTGNN